MKKASFFVPATTIFVAITLITAIILLTNKADDELERPIGARQFKLFSTYQRAENAMDYLELAAKYAMVDSVFALANNSGFYGESYGESVVCGRFASFNSWGNSDDGYPCYPTVSNHEFFGFFGQILNYTYLPMHNDTITKDEDGINLSTYFNLTEDDLISLVKKGDKIELAMKQGNPDLNINFNYKGEQINHSVKFSFRQSAEPNVIAAFDYLKNNVVKISNLIGPYPPLFDSRTFSEVSTDGKEYTWHNGGCVDTTKPGIDAQAEKFYKFVEGFLDCQQRDMTGNPDDWGLSKCRCGTYDVTDIDSGYRYVLRQLGGRTRFALEELQRINNVDIWVELWATWSEPNTIIYGERYNCLHGTADCFSPREPHCTGTDLSNAMLNCGACGRDLTATAWYCNAGVEWCSTSGCQESETEACSYVCGSHEECSGGSEGGCDKFGFCWPEEPEECDDVDDYCDDYLICMHSSCSFSDCPGSSINPGTPTPKNPALMPGQPDSYPGYSYDYSDDQIESTTIVIDRDSCQSPGSRFCRPNSNNIEFIKIDGNVGFLDIDSEDITAQSNYISQSNYLAAWPECGPKKTYRFCVQTMDDYLVYKESADSLLTDSKANILLSIMPIRYKFAVRVLP